MLRQIFKTLTFGTLAAGGACHSNPPKNAAGDKPNNDKAATSAAPSSTPPAAVGLPDRDPALAKRLVEEENAVLLDVRTQEEWDSGHIEGAKHIPIADLKDRLGEVETLTQGDKGKPIVTYCRSGGRAGRAKKLLLESGYERVTNMGGLSDWPEGSPAAK